MRRTKQFVWGSKRRKVVASILALVLVSTTAFAAWSIITASGTGSAKAGSLQAPTIGLGTTLVPDLFPSSPAGSFNATGTLTMTITNPNAGTLTLTGFTLDDDAVTGGISGCDMGATGRNAWLFIAGQTSPAAAAAPVVKTGLSIPVPPGASQVNVPNMIGLTSDTPSACQNATLDSFTLTNVEFQTGS